MNTPASVLQSLSTISVGAPITRLGVSLIPVYVHGPSVAIRTGRDVGAVITELPDGAVLLLTNQTCRVQGFRLGDTAYGLQLHPELDAATFRSWADPPDEALLRSGIDPLEAAIDVEEAQAALIAACMAAPAYSVLA